MGKESSILTPNADSYEDWLSLFLYDSEEILGLQERHLRTEDDVIISELSYGSPVEGRVQAYLVEPNGEGSFAGIIYFHWYEPRAETNNHTEFLDEAVNLAREGAISLLIQGFLPWSQPPDAADPQVDRDQVVRQVLDLRRGVDVLLSRQGVDADRLGFVGHDFGAMYGAVLGGIDPRLKAYVLMASTGSFSNWFFKYWKSDSPRDEKAYRAGMTPVDPLNYLGHISPASLLFQFADQDPYVSKDDAQEQYQAANQPKSIQWYDAGHELNEAAQKDRVEWLRDELDLGE